MVAEKVLGLLMGIGITFLLFAAYFFAMGKRSIFRIFGESLEREIDKAQNGRNTRVILDKAKRSFQARDRVGHYLALPFQIKRVEELPVNFRKVVHALNRNHGNLLVMQIVFFLAVAALGLLEENKSFQIPAGASILLGFSLIMMTAGAITFWFRKLGILPLLLLGLFLYLYDSRDFLHEKHRAIGMDYTVEAADYSMENLDYLSRESVYQADRKSTLHMLDRWKARYQAKYGLHVKPKAVFVTSSGWRTAFFILEPAGPPAVGFADRWHLYRQCEIVFRSFGRNLRGSLFPGTMPSPDGRRDQLYPR